MARASVGSLWSIYHAHGPKPFPLEIECTNVKSLGATIFHVPPEGVFASKESPTEVAFVVALLHVDTLVMPLQVGFADELLGAAIDGTGKRVFAFLVMGL